MVYSGYVLFYGISLTLDELKVLTRLLLEIHPKIKDMLYGKGRYNSEFSRCLPKDIISMIFSYVEEPDLVKFQKYLDLKDIKPFEIVFYSSQILESHGFNFETDTQRCCYDDGTIFFGFNLGETSFVYRDSIDEYDTFDDYHLAQKEQLDAIKELYDESKENIDSNFERLFSVVEYIMDTKNPPYPNLEIIDDIYDYLQNSLKFITYANDCENCS